LALPFERIGGPEEAEFQRLMEKHGLERQNLALEFRKEHSQILSNYYDAQLRENSQRNNVVDHRPLSDALRHISRRIAYPVDQGQQRFYKYQFRCEKLTKKFQKGMERLQLAQEGKADALYQKQLQDVLAYGDIHRIDLTELKIPKVVVPATREASG
jgi:hypothetical protein